MGFKRKRIYTLKFDDPELEGLEATATGPTINELMKIQENEEALSSSNTAIMDEIYRILAKHLNTWSLEEDDGSATPITLETLQDLDFSLLQAILTAWTTAVVGVTENLEQTSNHSEIAESLPMETR